ncbi:MAG: coenzyme F420-0:L-glutamate ligase [Actinomycetota bacterium]|nr:coenzyme F420-0:L-glutamate ligase [Actinomycetota bacterium]
MSGRAAAGVAPGDEVRIMVLGQLPEVVPGDDIAGMLAAAAMDAGLEPGDVLAVAHKVVSKAEGRVVRLDQVQPGGPARDLAEATGKDPALCQVILDESRAVIRRRRSLLVCETHQGFICANAGVDASNTPDGTVVLLPVDPDASARRIQRALSDAAGGRVGVVITDTHGRAFRRGLVNVAVGVAGFAPVLDHRGGRDREGRMLVATDQALADEIAAAAGMLIGKSSGRPAALVRGLRTAPAPGSSADLVRREDQDVFRARVDEHGVVI